MKNFDIDYTDQLTEQQVRYLLKSELERNKLLVRQNKFVLFRYEVKEDTMVLLYLDPDGNLAHQSFEHYLQQSPEKFFGQEQHHRIAQSLKRVIHNPDYPKSGSEDFIYKNGEGVCAEYTCLFDEVGRIITIVGQIVDVYQTHDRMVSTIQLLNEQITMTSAIRQSYETMIFFDMQDFSFQVIQGTPEVRAAGMRASNVKELAQLFCKYYVDPAFQQAFTEFVNEGTVDDRLAGNRYVACEYMTTNIGWCRARIMPADIDSAGHIRKAIFTTESVADHHEALSVLRVAASKDGLTGLLNRVTGEQAINESLQKHEAAIFLIFDCDNFKTINDKLGHPTGDQVLIEVAKSLREVYDDQIVLRLGGDEFVVYITDPTLVSQAQDHGMISILIPLYQRLRLINIPQLNHSTPTVSTGAVLIPAGTDIPLSRIYELGDKKLYEAKHTHNGALSSMEIKC